MSHPCDHEGVPTGAERHPLWMQEIVLSLRNFGVAIGERRILAEINLDVPTRGVVVVVGPGGAGKSTLLRTLAGHFDTNPSFLTRGDVHYAGARWREGSLPALVAQNARLTVMSVLSNLIMGLPGREGLSPRSQRAAAASMIERLDLTDLRDRLNEPVAHLPVGAQRRIAIARTIALGTPLIMLDEPTADIDDASRDRILGMVRRAATRRAVLIVTHNRRDALALGGHTALLAGGRILEYLPTRWFFDRPGSEAGRAFVRMGNCSVPSLDAQPEDLEPDTEPPKSFSPAPDPPVSLRWVKPDRLAGIPRPGLLANVEDDLVALQRAGITTLVCLEETQPIPDRLLAAYGMSGLFLPIEDMRAPDPFLALALCKAIDARLRRGERVAVHCRAGLGRTGTLLAAFLIWEGLAAHVALAEVRRVQPRFVQSEEQVRFLEDFARERGPTSGVRDVINPVTKG